ncbi:hypothetical protein PHMEG_00024571 [Phytophthora megakarya]|uniref:Uncharacterized protein n=1 Tax=Phytophthora megakarya TaxID=4795 RepID=A0A225VGQ7_9STRA|nr:hypothetical protein PHMEG_00024571 [Phytophthora megakarya]
MERALVLRRHFFSVESEEVIKACRALAEMCNLLAMSFLQQDNYAVTFDLLKKAEILTQRHHPVERATTMNNLACYYRRLGKLHSAMNSLKHALELEKRLEHVRNAADTQLNMCAVLSQLGRHQEALEHAQEALITLQEGFIHEEEATDATIGIVEDPSRSRLDRISVMCIAYHNIGVEQEFLKDCAESVASYKKGISLAEQYLGADHSITTTIRNSYLAAKRTLAAKTRIKLRSAGHNDKSPTRAGGRRLLSPRSASLRMPSSLAKEKDRYNIPTPRSIIADALSRAPLSNLPTLEVQIPLYTSKKMKTVIPNEMKSTTPPMSPTDPFFSPRFRFDSAAADQQTKKLASITKPRTTNSEVRTPQVSNDEPEKRKSNLKRSSTALASGRVRKVFTDAGANASRETGPTQNTAVAETIHAESESHDYAYQCRGNLPDISAQEMKLAIPQVRLDKRTTRTVQQYIDGVITTVLENVIGMISQQEYDLHCHGVDIKPADENIITTPTARNQETLDDSHDHTPDVNINVADVSSDTLDECQTEIPEPTATIAGIGVGMGSTTDELTATNFPDNIIGEPSQHLTETKVSESSGNDVQNDLEARYFPSLEPSSGGKNPGAHDTKEELFEIIPREAIANHTIVEFDGASNTVRGQMQ